MNAIEYLSIAVVVLLIGAQLLLRPLLVSRRRLATGIISGTFLATMVLQIWGYFVDIQNSPGFIKFLIPPYQPIDYFLKSSLTRFIIPYLISLAIALLFLLWTKLLSKERRESIFEEDEPFLISASIFLVGHPLWLTYLLLALVMILITQAFFARKEIDKRVSLYRLWLPMALCILSASQWLKEIPFVKILRLM